MIDVVGLSGKIGSGKDHIARQYFKPHGYYNFSLAWHFKVWLAGKGEATYDEVFHTKPPHIRDLLQKEGTERGRIIFGNDVWVDTMFTWMELLSDSWGINKFIVPDVRFKNEVEALQSRGGRVIRIMAPVREEAAHPTEEAKHHISETDLDDFTIDWFDGLIFNDPAYKDTVNAQVNHFLGLPTDHIVVVKQDIPKLPPRKVEDLVGDINKQITTMYKTLKMSLKK
jgi:hypothetical protein